jgi:hypothetical protein
MNSFQNYYLPGKTESTAIIRLDLIILSNIPDNARTGRLSLRLNAWQPLARMNSKPYDSLPWRSFPSRRHRKPAIAIASAVATNWPAFVMKIPARVTALPVVKITWTRTPAREFRSPLPKSSRPTSLHPTNPLRCPPLLILPADYAPPDSGNQSALQEICPALRTCFRPVGPRAKPVLGNGPNHCRERRRAPRLARTPSGKSRPRSRRNG